MNEKYSKTLQDLLKNKSGFRNDKWTNVTAFDLNDVIYEEINGLKNNDILYYLNNIYDANIDFECKDRYEEWRSEGMTEEDIKEEEHFSFSENSPFYVDEVKTFIKNKLGKDNLYAIWLTTVEATKEKYYSHNMEITEYNIPENALIISDLDRDGILFVTEIHPNFLKVS